MKNRKFACLFAFCLTIVFMACNQEDDNDLGGGLLDTDQLCQALIDGNEEVVKTEFLVFTQDLEPMATTDDPLGHEVNLNTLIERMNNVECITSTTFICYACIETLPAISEFRIEVSQDGSQVSKVIDIRTPEDGKLVFAGMHD